MKRNMIRMQNHVFRKLVRRVFAKVGAKNVSKWPKGNALEPSKLEQTGGTDGEIAQDTSAGAVD